MIVRTTIFGIFLFQGTWTTAQAQTEEGESNSSRSSHRVSSSIKDCGRIFSRLLGGTAASAGLLYGGFMGASHVLRESDELSLRLKDSSQKQFQDIDVVLLGDSLSQDFYFRMDEELIGKFVDGLSMIWDMRTNHMGGWFSDDQIGQAPQSLVERLSKFTNVRSKNLARISAYTDDPEFEPNPILKIHTSSFGKQINELERSEFDPNLALVWIGHNAMDWRLFSGVENFDLKDPKIQDLVRKTVVAYKKGMDRLNKKMAHDSGKKKVLVYYGLINFESFFAARHLCRDQKKADTSLYPEYYNSESNFISMQEAYCGGMIQMAREVDKEIKKLVLLAQAEAPDHLKIYYSDVFSRIDLTVIPQGEALSSQDAWHTSTKGQDLLSEKATEALLSILAEEFSLE